ncbi:MAG: ATP-binding protein [Cypionkella sp.]|nr:ATP-binding protein [Cypionkella sp.]
MECLFAQEPLRCLSDDLRGTAEIVMAEALNNIVEHAYAAGAGAIEISVDLGETGLNCTIADYGTPMPGHSLPQGAPHALNDMDDLPEGGFGWFLIRTLAQDLQYSRIRDQNFLRFRLPAHELATSGRAPLGLDR